MRRIGQPIGADQLEALNLAIKLENSAGLTLDIIPGGKLSRARKSASASRPGSRAISFSSISMPLENSGRYFRMPTRRRRAERTQPIWSPGQPLTIPQLGTAYASFEFIAEPPAGVAMVVALLSDKPVQIVDLPDAPPPAFAPNDSLKYVACPDEVPHDPAREGQPDGQAGAGPSMENSI